MKLIIGLGNPGKQYENTRHNAGFRFLDQLAAFLNYSDADDTAKFAKNEKFLAETLEIKYRGENIVLAKPQTYMNLSGKSVSMMMSYFKISPDDLIVVSDDVDLPIGQARIRHDGSSGGQKGLQSIIETTGDNFVRVRIGVGNGERHSEFDTADFVLSQFDQNENEILTELFTDIIHYIKPFVENGEKIIAHTLSVE